MAGTSEFPNRRFKLGKFYYLNNTKMAVAAGVDEYLKFVSVGLVEMMYDLPSSPMVGIKYPSYEASKQASILNIMPTLDKTFMLPAAMIEGEVADDEFERRKTEMGFWTSLGFTDLGSKMHESRSPAKKRKTTETSEVKDATARDLEAKRLIAEALKNTTRDAPMGLDDLKHKVHIDAMVVTRVIHTLDGEVTPAGDKKFRERKATKFAYWLEPLEGSLVDDDIKKMKDRQDLLEAENESLRAENESLKAELEKVKEKNRELNRELNQLLDIKDDDASGSGTGAGGPVV